MNQTGKLGNLVYTRNATGYFARNRVKPAQPRTAAQTTQKNNLRDASRAYKALTSAQVASWASAAATYPQTTKRGKSTNLTGQQLYMKLNLKSVSAGTGAQTTPPLTALNTPLSPMPSATFAYSAGAITMTDTLPTTAVTGSALLVQASAPLPSSRIHVPCYKNILTLATHNSSATAITSAYTAIWGTLPTTGVVWFKVLTVYNGVVQNVAIVSVIL
jgi:hypothetical protein